MKNNHLSAHPFQMVLVAWADNRQKTKIEDNGTIKFDCRIISTAKLCGTFHRVILFNNGSPIPKEYIEYFHKQTSQELDIHNVQLMQEDDYLEIYDNCSMILSEILKSNPNTDFTFVLGSGPSHAMSLCWCFLKKDFSADLIENGSALVLPFDFEPKHISTKTIDAINKINDSSKEFSDIIYKSQTMERAINLAKKFAYYPYSILIEGESGTGKELFAKAIHQASPRAKKPFQAINCGAIPHELIESELFGHEKGAFTGAIAQHVGYIEKANGGTLFLDEIGEMPLSAQVKLLRVLNDQMVMPLGGKQPVKVDVRVIAATNRNLMESVRKKEFRLDLFYRIAELQLKLPSLRERGDEDFDLLIDFFLNEFNKEDEKQKNTPMGITLYARRYLKSNNLMWYGNIRELRNVILRAAILSNNRLIGYREVCDAMFDNMSANDNDGININTIHDIRLPLDYRIAEFTIQEINRALELCDQKKEKTAELLGLKDYRTLDRRLKGSFKTKGEIGSQADFKTQQYTYLPLVYGDEDEE